MNKKYKKIPRFKNEKEEVSFWETHNFIDYIDWSKAEKDPVFPNLKPSTKTISIRFAENIINEIKRMANEDDMPYQSLIKSIVGQYIRDRDRNSIPSPFLAQAVLSNENTSNTAKENKPQSDKKQRADNKLLKIKTN